MNVTRGRSSEDVVHALRRHGIAYLTSGPEVTSASPWSIQALVEALVAAPEARLRDALVALLLRHPEYAPQVTRDATSMPTSNPVRCRILLSVLVAAALQREWSFTLDIYLPGQELIDGEEIAKELGLPSPGEDYGRPCLKAAAELLRQNAEFPINYEEGWRDAARRLFDQLMREAHTHEPAARN